MDVAFTLRLPVEVASVPFVRRLCRLNLEVLGISELDISDVALAVTEACANVVEHAETGHEYEVRFRVDAMTCRIAVLDTGAGFDPDLVRPTAPGSVFEGGRGIELMRSLVDTLAFHPRSEDGTVVELVKALRVDETSPLWRLPLGTQPTG